jgi:hypothetical protein
MGCIVYVTNVVTLKGFYMTIQITKDDIIQMARDSGWLFAEADAQRFERFAKLVAAKAAEREREACAQILANTDLSGLRDHPLQNWVAGMLFEFIKAIRARGEA